MVVVVPFDGSALSKSALLHAAWSAELYHETPVAVTIIPDKDTAYAQEKGWLSSTETFDIDTIVFHLREQVRDLAPAAEFEYVVVGKYAPSGTITSRIRRFARTHDTSAIFIGSENAGSSVLGLDSVGRRIAAEKAYDIVIIRNTLPEVETTG